MMPINLIYVIMYNYITLPDDVFLTGHAQMSLSTGGSSVVST